MIWILFFFFFQWWEHNFSFYITARVLARKERNPCIRVKIAIQSHFVLDQKTYEDWDNISEDALKNCRGNFLRILISSVIEIKIFRVKIFKKEYNCRVEDVYFREKKVRASSNRLQYTWVLCMYFHNRCIAYELSNWIEYLYYMWQVKH